MKLGARLDCEVSFQGQIKEEMKNNDQRSDPSVDPPLSAHTLDQNKSFISNIFRTKPVSRPPQTTDMSGLP